MTIKTGTYLIGTPSGRIGKQDITVAAETSTSGTNGLKLVNYRFSENGQHYNFYGTLSGGAHINLYVFPFPGNTTIKHLETVISAGSSSFSSITNTFAEVLNGDFWGVEGVKVCAGGARMVGYI